MSALVRTGFYDFHVVLLEDDDFAIRRGRGWYQPSLPSFVE
jgi:hypothetical protein